MAKDIASFNLEETEGKVKAFNGKNATDGSLRDLLGRAVTLEDVLIHSDSRVDEETGEMIESDITVLYTSEGVFGGNSAVLRKTAEDIMPLLESIGKMDVEVFTSKSSNGREFLNFKLVS